MISHLGASSSEFFGNICLIWSITATTSVPRKSVRVAHFNKGDKTNEFISDARLHIIILTDVCIIFDSYKEEIGVLQVMASFYILGNVSFVSQTIHVYDLKNK